MQAIESYWKDQKHLKISKKDGNFNLWSYKLDIDISCLCFILNFQDPLQTLTSNLLYQGPGSVLYPEYDWGLSQNVIFLCTHLENVKKTCRFFGV